MGHALTFTSVLVLSAAAWLLLRPISAPAQSSAMTQSAKSIRAQALRVMAQRVMAQRGPTLGDEIQATQQRKSTR